MSYPPPQGQNPYAQTGPYGRQPPPSSFGPPQPSYAHPQQPQPGYQYPQQQWGAPQPARRSPAKKILLIAAVAIGLILAAIVVLADSDGAEQAKAGDCMTNDGTQLQPELRIVACTEATAEYKVVEVIKGTSDPKVCEAKSDSGYFQERSSGTKFVLCLNQITP
jgi:hypothetical protein